MAAPTPRFCARRAAKPALTTSWSGITTPSLKRCGIRWPKGDRLDPDDPGNRGGASASGSEKAPAWRGFKEPRGHRLDQDRESRPARVVPVRRFQRSLSRTVGADRACGAKGARAGREGAKICVVGDTPRDIDAARANFLSVIAVATGKYSFDELLSYRPEACVSSLKDLLAAGQSAS